MGPEGGGERCEDPFVRQVDAGGVRPVVAVERTRQRYGGVGAADTAVFLAEPVYGHEGIFHQGLDGDGRVGDPVDEGRIGTVFQQAPHQVGQQRLVCANRGIDAAGPAKAALARCTDHLFIERLAHAMEALELVLPGCIGRGLGHPVDGRHRVGIVGCELRIHLRRRGQQPLRAGQVGDVGIGLAGVDRVALLAVELGAFDLGVPVGTLHQPDHEPVLAAPGQVDQVVDDEGASLLVGLDDKTDAIPARQRGLEAEFFQQVQREFEPVGLFGIDVQADVERLRLGRECEQHRVQLVHHPLVLGPAITGMQRRELDRDARPCLDTAAVGRLADRLDRLLVVAQVPARIAGRQRRLAEHVVGVTEALRLPAPGVVERLLDSLSGDELLPHHAHRHVHPLADQRFTSLRREPAQVRTQTRFTVRGQEFAGQQQAPARGVDEKRRAAAQVPGPVALRDLVADEGIACAAVRDTQQRFRQAHQCNAFLRRQGVFLQQALDDAGPAAGGLAVPQGVRQAPGQR